MILTKLVILDRTDKEANVFVFSDKANIIPFSNTGNTSSDKANKIIVPSDSSSSKLNATSFPLSLLCIEKSPSLLETNLSI